MKSFTDYNPIAIFIYYFCVLLPIMFCQNPVISIIGFLSGIIYVIVKNGLKGLKNSTWMLLIPVFTMLINPIFNHSGSTVLFILNNNPITLEAVLYGFFMGFMIGGMLLWFKTFSEIMTSDKLLYIFGSVSPKFALILSMTLRYIPLFKQQITKTNNAQKALGLYKEDNAIDKIKGGMRIFSVMVTWALENGVITADSMTARGYGIGKRSRFAIFFWSKTDYILTAVSSVMLLFVGAAYLLGKISFTWYPYIQSSEVTAFTVIIYIIFGILCLIPDYLQIKEDLKWKSLQSKI